jgi:hypothetical protein
MMAVGRMVVLRSEESRIFEEAEDLWHNLFGPNDGQNF